MTGPTPTILADQPGRIPQARFDPLASAELARQRRRLRGRAIRDGRQRDLGAEALEAMERYPGDAADARAYESALDSAPSPAAALRRYVRDSAALRRAIGAGTAPGGTSR